MKGICYFCGREIEVSQTVGRLEMCPYCRRDLHSCVQCRFYDAAAYNECRETQAERVIDKEKSNFCDYFEFSGRIRESIKKEDVISKLEGLFKK